MAEVCAYCVMLGVPALLVRFQLMFRSLAPSASPVIAMGIGPTAGVVPVPVPVPVPVLVPDVAAVRTPSLSKVRVPLATLVVVLVEVPVPVPVPSLFPGARGEVRIRDRHVVAPGVGAASP